MRFILILLCALFVYNANAELINMDWIVDGNTYTTTTCNIGDDLILPTAPTKYGYTFQGWTTYTPIEYIESTGTQYINTGITGNVVVRGIAQTVVITGPSQVLFGTRVDGAGGTYFGVANGATNWGLGGLPTTGVSTIPATTKATIEVTFDGNGATGAVNGKTIERRTSAEQGALYIFATTSGNYKGAFKLWSCQVYQDNMLVRDFIPVLNSTNVVGLYDTISGQFFTNAGTGDFIAGPVIE